MPLDDQTVAGALGKPPDMEGDPREDRAFALDLNEFIREKSDKPSALIGHGDDILMPAYGFGILAGKSGKGKTTLAIDLAFHLASGRDWLGHHVPRALQVLLVENEGHRELFRRKLERRHQTWPHVVEGGIHVHTLAWGQFRLDDQDGRAKLRTYVAEHEIDLVIADPLGSFGTHGVGSPDQTSEFVRFLVDVGLGRTTAFLFLHHFRKEGARDELDELSGAWAQHADLVLTLAVPSGNRSRLGYPKQRWGVARPPSMLTFDPETESFEYAFDEGGDGRRYTAELVALMENHEDNWHTLKELAERKEGGIGADKDKVSDAIGLAFDEDGELNVENIPDEFVVATGPMAGRPKAKVCVGLRARVGPEVERGEFHQVPPDGFVADKGVGGTVELPYRSSTGSTATPQLEPDQVPPELTPDVDGYPAPKAAERNERHRRSEDRIDRRRVRKDIHSASEACNGASTQGSTDEQVLVDAIHRYFPRAREIRE